MTFLFTDIEGSTRLLQQIGDRYAAVLEGHRRQLRAALARHAGVEVDTQGDAFFVAFAEASDAVAAAVDAQRAFTSGPVRVRMGIHTGEPALRDGGYVGIDVHRGARICAAAHGGQVLLSDATRRSLDTRSELLDLGEHRLKDLSAREWLFQVLAPGLEERFPPLRTLNNTNLPVLASSLVGRQRELAEIGWLLDRDDVRLITLSGAGGTGKTRLALSLAAALNDRFKNGVFLVELASVVEPSEVLPTIARTLGAKESGTESPHETLRRYLESRSMLLVLDNFEQVLPAASEIGKLLTVAEGIKLIVTSRERLRIRGEHEYAVQPLGDSEAIELFDTRAAAVKPAFQPERERPHVAAICRRVDGLPLAVELAAARVKLISPKEILARLEAHLPVLTGGPRDLPQRQQTLRATIDWSYALLGSNEQELLAHLGVFVGGCTLAAAEAVCDASIDRLESLLDKSLLRQGDEVGEETRFSMLETIREYALERLRAGAAEQKLRERHARYYALIAAEAHAAGAVHGGSGNDTYTFYGGANEGAMLNLFDRERDNLTAALSWFLERREARPAIGLMLTFARLWLVRGPLRDGRAWMERVIGLDGVADQPEFGWLLTFTSEFPHWQGDLPRARAVLEQAIAILKRNDEKARLAIATHALANIAALQTDFGRAHALNEQGLLLGREAGDPGTVAFGLHSGALLAFYEGNYGRMAAIADEALRLCRAAGNISPSLMLGTVSMVGDASCRLGDFKTAAARYRETLLLAEELDDLGYVAECIDGLADVAAGLGDFATAVPLWAWSERILEETGISPWDPDGQQRGVASAREVLGNDAFGSAWRSGLAMSRADAVREASIVGDIPARTVPG